MLEEFFSEDSKATVALAEKRWQADHPRAVIIARSPLGTTRLRGRHFTAKAGGTVSSVCRTIRYEMEP